MIVRSTAMCSSRCSKPNVQYCCLEGWATIDPLKMSNDRSQYMMSNNARALYIISLMIIGECEREASPVSVYHVIMGAPRSQ